MADRPFRFGAVVAPQEGTPWRATVRRVAELGYSAVLMPDGLQLLSPFTSLAVAAEAADVRVGTFVLAGPLRRPRMTAWDAHSLTVLTDGRFDLGIGTGRPAVREWTDQMGLPFGSSDERLRQVADTIDELRAMDGERHTPVMIAAGGPKALALAAATADVVTLAIGPLAGRDRAAQLAAQLRELAADRADAIELSMNIFVVGDEVAPWVQGFLGADAQTMIEHDSMTMLRGTPDDMADELLRRRAEIGVSYVTVNGAAMEAFAPVLERLHGR